MYDKTQKLLYRLLVAALILGGAAICLHFVLPWISPFIVAMLIAALSEPAVKWLSGRRLMPRSGAAGLCTVLLLAAGISVLILGIGRGITELGGITSRLPEMLSAFSERIAGWQSGILKYIDNAPGDTGKYLQTVFDTVSRTLSQFPGWLSEHILGFVTSFASNLPSTLLFVITSGIGAYFCSASYPEILRFLKRQIPEELQTRAKMTYEVMRKSVIRFVKAQLILTTITFFELLIAFWLLHVSYFPLIAAVVAFVDILPILGVGTVLLPWAFYELLANNQSMAVGLIITYVGISIIRNTIQAKLIGDQLGLHPVVTLIAIYVGFRALGVWGMILFPILAVALQQLQEHGLIKLWKEKQE